MMSCLPDVQGYFLESAISRLNCLAWQITISHTGSQNGKSCGPLRVLRMKVIAEEQVELVVAPQGWDEEPQGALPQRAFQV